MRCPSCEGVDDKVVDSRLVDDGGSIRRRRECIQCGQRFTTFERLEDAPLWVVKRSGERELFDLDKLAAGIEKACKNRPIDQVTISSLAEEIEEVVRARSGSEVTSRDVGEEVLARLAQLDEVAYLRFASVYLRFDALNDFAREVGKLRRQSHSKT